jgi:thioredoxin 1
MAFELTDQNFAERIETGVTVVDFWAEWCGPCRMIAPIIEELSVEYKEKALIGKLNVDENPEVSIKYGIRSIPTILVLKDGQEVARQVGTTSKKNLARIIDDQLSPAQA